MELNTNGHHTTYEMKISGFDLDYKANKVYGVVLTTADGSEYGLHHVTNIWHGTKLGFNADDPYFAFLRRFYVCFMTRFQKFMEVGIAQITGKFL